MKFDSGVGATCYVYNCPSQQIVDFPDIRGTFVSFFRKKNNNSEALTIIQKGLCPHNAGLGCI